MILLKKAYLPAILLVIVIIGSFFSPFFLTTQNAINVIAFSTVIGLLSLGQFYVILTGGIDLSVSSILALATVISALTLQAGYGLAGAALFTLAACGFSGALNGVLIVWLRIPPFIATLSTMTALRGVSYVIQSTNLIGIDNQSFITWFSNGSILGISMPVWILAIITVITAFVSAFTIFGRELYAIGGNPEAARLSGIPVGRRLITTYTISGLLAGLAGLLAAAQLQQGSSLIGRGYELNSIAAVVVGGATLMGGRGDPISTIIGVFILAVITNIMNLVGISSQPQLIIKGLVILIAVFLSSAGGADRIANFFWRQKQVFLPQKKLRREKDSV